MALTRQVHLDFHCSEFIEDIGKKFDAKSFQACLKKAKVNSINLFAKCHHSWSYYPTKIGKVHPHLNFDLLGQQIKASQAIGLKTFIYFTVGWSANDAEENPDWCARNKDGSFIIHSPIEAGESENSALPYYHWKFMCVNGGYHQLINDQIKELCELYTVDGFWFDIYQVHRKCFCLSCLNSMKSMAYDVNNFNDVETHNAYQIKTHCNALNQLIHQYMPEAKVFFNGTTALDEGAIFRHKMYENNTIQDLEDLPTTWGGYDKLPMQAKYFLNADYPITAMSGKFHTAWGEFGGFKHPDALKYEAAAMVASGANCNFGDQLHPNGIMDISTYENIGHAFDYVEQIEDYGIGGKPISRLGLWRSFDQESDEGLSQMLLEKQIDFDVANFSRDFKEYEVLVLPSNSSLSEEEIQRLRNYIRLGGAVISLSKSLLNFLEDGIAKDFGVRYHGNSNFDCDYTLIKEPLYPSFVKTPFLNYHPAICVKPADTVEVLAEVYEPYFNRTIEHYCSHQKTPYKEKKATYPAVIKRKNCIFIAHDLDIMYKKFGARIHRDLFNSCLNLLYKNPYIIVKLPSSARVNLLHQEEERRFVFHLLYSTPLNRGVAAVIEDHVPLCDVEVYFNFPKKINKVMIIPDCKSLSINRSDSGYFVTIPRMNMHCALVFHY